MKTSSDALRDWATKAVSDKESERAGWEQSYNALLAQFRAVPTEKALIGSGSFLGGVAVGYGLRALSVK